MNFAEHPINEKKLIKRKCQDIILSEEKGSKKHLNQGYDNILLVLKQGDRFFIDCTYRSYISKTIEQKFEPPFVSKNCKLSSGEYQTFYPISTSFNPQLLFKKEDLERLLNTNYRIYYIQPYINPENNIQISVDCQGRSYLVYTITVCGGRRCLPKIFGPHPSDEKVEEINDEYFDEYYDEDADDLRTRINMDLRDAIDDNDIEFLNNLINELMYDFGEDPAEIINEAIGLDFEPLFIYAIKSRNFQIIERLSQLPDIDFNVDDEGITPIVAAYFFSQTPEEFQTILRVMYNLNEDLESNLNTDNLREAFNNPINLRVGGYFNNILDLIERYPYPINHKQEKLEFLRDVKEANEF